ncbi:biosynthetic arginine decarboxylase [Desulfonema magnum]|uniref:Arginine decarboxylase n=1 Tax=Desulfonema magnum TaxID=45655 RepID=A0A975BLK9_9BACT|nr:biosynthetic arginine decarboxylase [Desulfonema magnum]QTA87832.1 Biosynthetic arginine decarboxylase [Desulfonema magnum]
MPKWNISQSKKLYNIQNWGENFFDISKDGELTVSPRQEGSGVSLYEIAQDLTDRGFSLPILLRFPDILRQRVKRLCNAFAMAMEKENYHANYTLVYPIKVNQQRSVIETIVNTGQAGLEAGSKSEMMAILALSPPNGVVVICNGYKDREYVRMALIAQKMGLQPYIVVEKTSELKLIVQEADNLNVVPRLGIRVKLASVANGKWQDSGGAKSKFGLNAAQIIDVVNLLRQAGQINSLQLMHFHVGSQIPSIYDIQKILSEAGYFYAELRALGAPIRIVDVGGGLGVDYEGMLSSRPFSKNYTMEEYANNIIYQFKDTCNASDLPQPDIITETGRAITAHSSVLITNIVDIEPVSAVAAICPASDEDPEIIHDLWCQLNNINQASALEVYHNAMYWLNEMHVMFSYGVINLRQRAHAEHLFYSICLKISELLKKNLNSSAHYEALDKLNDNLADKYFANFSLFASAPDAWALGQLFPIVPLHRLNAYPDTRATLHDLTCDSDGRFKQYVHGFGTDTSLPVHSPVENEPYLIGIFLLGAYQEILGDMHNLFGTTHSVNVHITKDNNYTFTDTLKGDTVQKMLDYVNFNTVSILENFQKRLQFNRLNPEQRLACMRELETMLNGYTYLDDAD